MIADLNTPSEAAYAPMVTEEMIEERDWKRSQVPAFRVSEVAKFFFGMSESWLRLKLREDEDHPDTWFVNPDGTKMEFRRKDAERGNSERVFLLSDIEPMAWSLVRFGSIGGLRLAHILSIVQAVGVLYGLVPSEAPEDPPGPGDGAGE